MARNFNNRHESELQEHKRLKASIRRKSPKLEGLIEVYVPEEKMWVYVKPEKDVNEVIEDLKYRLNLHRNENKTN